MDFEERCQDFIDVLITPPDQDVGLGGRLVEGLEAAEKEVSQGRSFLKTFYSPASIETYCQRKEDDPELWEYPHLLVLFKKEGPITEGRKIEICEIKVVAGKHVFETDEYVGTNMARAIIILLAIYRVFSIKYHDFQDPWLALMERVLTPGQDFLLAKSRHGHLERLYKHLASINKSGDFKSKFPEVKISE